MKKTNDLTGQKFGKLTVLSRTQNTKAIVLLCQCDCGNTTFVHKYDLVHGKTKSCGCLRKELTAIRAKKHKMSNTRLYRIWNAMKERCLCETNPNYSNYGGRGISVCSEWKNDFQAFYEWAINNGYNEDLTLDRIEVNGNYEPSNCRWSTRKEQNFNKRNNRLLSYNGKTQTLQEWSKETGVSYTTLLYRIENGWKLEAALTLQPYSTRKNKQLNVYLK